MANAFSQAFTDITFAFAVVGSYYPVVTEHSLIYQFAGGKILETL
jgi:hypothetical protein